MAEIRVGVGGWTYEPWRETFYPADLPKTRELEFASRKLTSIEINGTFYRGQSPATFRKWASETPEDFVFSLKAHRVTTNRKDLSDAKSAIDRFVETGPLELGDRLGPILWQLAPTKRFNADEIENFLAYLPREIGGRRLRHAIEARHASFRDPGFVELARKYGAATVFAHSEKYAELYDVTGDFIYLRMQESRSQEPQGYSPAEIAKWAQRIKCWASGGVPDDLPVLAKEKPPEMPRDCFVYVISGAKERAPAAAMALIEELKGSS
ncbi:MAG: hypothetical protein QOC72_1369 [Methylobacteriaceae bacterium]|nr:hypothetical protein [Methylobacteriaceae bacterium]